jgi:hypothetical protein
VPPSCGSDAAYMVQLPRRLVYPGYLTVSEPDSFREVHRRLKVTYTTNRVQQNGYAGIWKMKPLREQGKNK